MKIRHERPMSDLSYRVRAPLTLELVDGERVVVDEWSLTGFNFPGSSDILPKQGILSIPFQGVDIRFEVKLEKGSEPRELCFAELTGRQRETLAVFYRSILSGKMASTEDIITSLDTPVDLVPMGEKEDEKAEGTKGKAPRFLRVIWNAFFYLSISFLVFGFVGGTIYDRLSGISLENGRVVSPLVEHRLSEDAFVEKIYVEVGDEVEAGALLVRLNSPERDGALDSVRIDIRQIERLIKDTNWRLDRLFQRKAEIKAKLEDEVKRQLSLLTLRDLLGGYNLERLNDALSELRAFNEDLHPLSFEFLEQEAQLRDLLDTRQADLRQLKRDLSNAKDASDAINVIAKTSGKITEIFVIEDLQQSRGTLAIVIEENKNRTVVGWINERAAQKIFVGQASNLRVATAQGSRSLKAEISNIEAGVDPANPGQFGVLVTLKSQQTDLEKNRLELRPNAPVQIKVDRGWSLTPFMKKYFDWWS